MLKNNPNPNNPNLYGFKLLLQSKKLVITLPLNLFFFIIIFLLTGNSYGQKLQVNELGYFETQGANVFVFNNQYNGFFFDEKTAGIELIHHGVRTATGGAVRLQNTPEQWYLVPAVVERNVNKKNNTIEVILRYEEYNFNSKLRVSAKDKGVEISVHLDEPVPEKLEGHAGLNLEFLPASYFKETYLVDGESGIFPLYPSGNTVTKPTSKKIPQFAGLSTFDDRGKNEFIVPKPLAQGKNIVLAPNNPERFVKIQSREAKLMLFDGRNLAQNGWYIIRSIIPADKTGKVLSWYLEANPLPDWKRKPNIGFSQVGYLPDQKKVATIELDKNDKPLKTASLFQVTQEGKTIKKLTSEIKAWGDFLRYHYVRFDFSSVKEPGLYYIQYGDQKTNTFPIDHDVYHEIWHPTMDVFFPVQMDHMKVNEAYRTWHGASFLDDALQAPTNHQHFDGYEMDSTTGTKYKPLERIPGLNVGGWFDAGDFDIQTGSHCGTILSLVDAWESFGLDRDETYVNHETRYVDIHRPDGKPDILQQIQHGTLNLVAQVKNIGFPIRGIVVPNLHQYHHLGDASTSTDNLPYNPELDPYESDGTSSGTMDDRWAFTERSRWTDYFTVAALAASNRALQEFDKDLSEECLVLAKKLWNESNDLYQNAQETRRSAWFGNSSEITAALQLYISTKNEKFAQKYNELIWPALDSNVAINISTALQAIPYMKKDYQSKLKKHVIQYKNHIDELKKENPYGVPVISRGWGGNRRVISWAISNYYAHKFFPDIIGTENVYKGLDYIFGNHPYSNISFVSAVGTESKQVAYGSNRADFSFIAGGVVPGLMLLKPDFLENKENWPFFWGENEYVIDNCADYIFLSGAANELIK